MKTSTWKALALFGIIGITILLFHKPIQIVNAVTLLPAEDFGLSLSFWRILFEPIVGPMLFYLRAGNPVEEFFVLFIWIIIGMFIWILSRQSIGKSLWRRSLKWLSRVPIIFSVWLAVLLIMIFAPLPNNRIVNNNPNTILLGTHSHTHYSHDGLISQKDMKDWHEKNGFDAFFITDHNHHEQTLDFINQQRRGVVTAKPMILCGEEFSGSNHILLLGFEHNTITEGFTDQEAIDAIHAQDGSAIVAHWFEGERNSIQHYIDKDVDGFEVANQNDVFYPERIHTDIVQSCQENDLLMIGSSDYHGYGATCFTWNALNIPRWNSMDHIGKTQSIMNIFKEHDQSKIQVLIYRDRSPVPPGRLSVSPIYVFFNYFRGLTFTQLISWLIWSLLIIKLLKTRENCKLCIHMKKRALSKTGLTGLVSSFVSIVYGLILLGKVEGLAAYNDIHQEYGVPFTVIGVSLFIYSLVLIFIVKTVNRR